jgi:superoxide dismutase, Cu-Zn family
MRSIGAFSACLATCSLMAIMPVQAQETASATFINAEGREIGSATLTETPHGVLIDATISGLPAGGHGFHIHEKGQCDAATGFDSAGGHYAPRKREHGYLIQDGPHAGDMPNQFVSSDGTLHLQVVNPDVTLGSGEGTLFDADGSAFILHANVDDYRSQPSGNAGGRIACAVIQPK